MTVDGSPLQVLLVEDNPGDARLIQEMLREAGPAYPLHRVDRLVPGLEYLAANGADVVLLDLSLPDAQGLDTFRRTRDAAPGVPIVVLSGLADETVAVQAVQEGAQDYLVKGQVDGYLLARAIRYAVERKRLEEERAVLALRERAAQRELERQKNEFFANISHDLRTPLFAIKISVGVLLANEPADLPEPLHRLLANIDTASDQLARLVDDLLELTRLQAGRLQLQRERCDLRALAQRAAQSIEPLAQARGQRLEVVLPPDAVEASVDSARLERVLVNLLSNAHKYGRAGGLIRLQLESAPDAVCLVVVDDGPGIALADQERIFERFERVQSSAEQVAGSGLGLPIARGVVELHGGRLSVESAPGNGATFRVSLPIDPPTSHNDDEEHEDSRC
jgi:signal transduction histidine kinase